jgi:hypothetical protein
MRLSKLIISVLLLSTTTLGAQTAPTITSIHVDVYKSTDLNTIVGGTNVAVANITCNQTPSGFNGPIINPNKIEYTDPAIAGRTCVADISAFLKTLPADSYVAKANFRYSDSSNGGTSDASNPFTIFLTLILQGLKLLK